MVRSSAQMVEAVARSGKRRRCQTASVHIRGAGRDVRYCHQRARFSTRSRLAHEGHRVPGGFRKVDEKQHNKNRQSECVIQGIVSTEHACQITPLARCLRNARHRKTHEMHIAPRNPRFSCNNYVESGETCKEQQLQFWSWVLYRTWVHAQKSVHPRLRCVIRHINPESCSQTAKEACTHRQ